MSNIITDNAVDTKLSLKQVFLEDFRLDLPIEGGWGYTKEDPIIIRKPEGLLPFDKVGLEYLVVEKRIYEELIIFRTEEKRYAGIKWDLVRQELITGDRQFDHLVFKVKAHKESDFFMLKEEFEKGVKATADHSILAPPFSYKKHKEKHESLQWSYEAEFWFDITEA